MNKDQISGEFRKFTGEAKRQWGKITDNEWTQIEGSNEKLSGQIQKSYGIAREEAEKQVKEFCETCDRDSRAA